MHFKSPLSFGAVALPAARASYLSDPAEDGAQHSISEIARDLAVGQKIVVSGEQVGNHHIEVEPEKGGGIFVEGSQQDSETIRWKDARKISGAEPRDDAPTSHGSDIIGPTWTVVEYYSAGHEEDGLVAPVEGPAITVEFESDGRFDGHGGCNSYGGSVEHGESSFDVAGPVGSTLVLCEEDAIGAQELDYLAIFEAGTTIDWILSDDGRSP